MDVGAGGRPTAGGGMQASRAPRLASPSERAASPHAHTSVRGWPPTCRDPSTAHGSLVWPSGTPSPRTGGWVLWVPARSGLGRCGGCSQGRARAHAAGKAPGASACVCAITWAVTVCFIYWGD